MKDPQLVPHKITKPIQLLAAWLAGLAVINGSFLGAAGAIHSPPWLPVLFAIAAVVNVPLFIVSLFLLQTKFRPEMQEDTFYSKYLERKYAAIPAPPKPVDIEVQLHRLADEIVSKVAETTTRNKQEKVVEILRESEVMQLMSKFEYSRSLSEIFMNGDKWPGLVDEYESNPEFIEETSNMIQSGLVIFENEDLRRPQLTAIGNEVAKRLFSEKKLWNQKPHRPIIERKRE